MLSQKDENTLDTALVKIQELVSSAATEEETLLLAAGMLSISRQIFEFYLGADHADQIFESHLGTENVTEYQVH